MSDWETIFKEKGKVFLESEYFMQEAIDLFKKNNIKKVLDLGCGSGRNTIAFAKAGFEVYGTDISESGLKITKKSLSDENLKAELTNTSCYEKFPFENDFFDAVVSTHVIHHNFHDKIVFCISEIERVLKKNGFLLLTVAAKVGWEDKPDPELVAPHTYIPMHGYEKGLTHYIYNKSLLRKDFRKFKIIKLEKDEAYHYLFIGTLK
ncbi:MAG: class I SAM-dependent methyltransferase [archaeon]